MTELAASDRVAANMRKTRKERGWSMAQLAERCGLSEDVIQHIESGRRDEEGRRRRHVTVDEAELIARAFWNIRQFSTGLLQDPDWEERNREQNRVSAAERQAMLNDPEIAMAFEALLSAQEAASYLQERVFRLEKEWRNRNV